MSTTGAGSLPSTTVSPLQTTPRFTAAGARRARASADPADLSATEQTEVRKLQARDREVRAHEQAHKATGGPHTGPATYQYVEGPDGRRYAVGGRVSADLAPVSGDPDATIRKMERVARAALAPAQPSAEDRAVAAKARQRAAAARLDQLQAADTEPATPPRGGTIDLLA